MNPNPEIPPLPKKTQLPCYAGLKGRNVHIMWPPSQLNHVFICFLSCVCDVCEIVFHFHESPPLHDVKHVWSWNFGEDKEKQHVRLSDCGFLPVNFPKKITGALGRLTFPSFSRVSFYPCSGRPLLICVSSGALVNGASSKSRPFNRFPCTKFAAKKRRGWSACRIASRLAGKLSSWSTKGWKLSF